MTESFKDRRKHVRIYRNYILTYHLKGRGDEKHEVSQVNNISKGGVHFVAREPFAAGSELVIGVKTPFLSDKVDFEGTVIESHEKVAGILYEVRLKFHDLSPHAKEIMDKIERAFTPNK